MRRTLAFRAFGFALGLSLIGAAAHWRGLLDWQPKTLDGALHRTRTEVVLREEKRKVYPYSVVPGGAKTLFEAKRAMSDPAVKDHYADVDFHKLRQATLTADLLGYVSYRVGDNIYWTTKLLRIKAGETVFTDGEHIVRGRCLNRYSRHAMLPTRPREPAEIAFETPVELPLLSLSFPQIPLPEAPQLPPPLEEMTPTVPALPVAGPPAPVHGGSGGVGLLPIVPFLPIIPLIPPIHRHPSRPPTVPVSPPPPVTTVVPEPGYRWLITGAILTLIVIWMRRPLSLK